MADKLIYLDYAATAGRRPPEVVAAVTAWLQGDAATPGRGTHRLAIEAGRLLLRCRQRFARIFGIPGDTGRIAFTFNATHALNAAVHGVVQAGDVLVVTDLDHNAVVRPAHLAERRYGATLRRVAADSAGRLDLAEFRRAVRGARLVSLNAASNVLGTVLDLEPLVAMARAEGALTLADAAQIAGHVPFDIAASGVDMVAFTGHKALLGPHGTGALWVRAGIEIDAWMAGGTGGNSASREMPSSMPDRLEAGSLNAPGLAGLDAALEWIEARGIASLAAEATARRQQLYEGLASVPGIRIHSPRATARLPIACITAAGLDPATLAAKLDREHGVLTRAGLHCAPDAHRAIGTADTGAVRLSAGWATTAEDIDGALAALRAVVGARAERVNVPSSLQPPSQLL
jgi:cysteine desulfurase / selenocysteine lyase